MSNTGTKRLASSALLRPLPEIAHPAQREPRHARRTLITALLLAVGAFAATIALQFSQRGLPAEAVAGVDAVLEAAAPPVVAASPALAEPAAPPAAAAQASAPAVAAVGVPAAPTPLGMRLRIPRIGVDAPMVSMGLGAGGQMPAPADDSSVAWYDFSAAPGGPGNALLAGHVDWVDHAAVFWHLRTVAPGDSITVTSSGQTFVYGVDRVYTVPFDVADTTGIVGRRTGAPTLTIVTCAGTFNAARHLYDQRLVVVSSLRS